MTNVNPLVEVTGVKNEPEHKIFQKESLFANEEEFVEDVCILTS